MESLFFTGDDARNMIKTNEGTHFVSRYGFLNAHNGFRRGSLHVLMGTAGSGKTTLLRSILRDFLFQRENMKYSVALWLSEESIQDYKTQMAKGMPSHDVLLNAFAISEMDMLDASLDAFLENLEVTQPDMLIIDNATTSRFYDNKRPEQQSDFIKRIKVLTKKINCATLIVAHTRAGIHDNQDRLIDIDDIRGNKSLANQAEFFYIWQRFQDEGENFYPTLRIRKHRGQDLINTFYLLIYDKETRSYKKDHALNFSMINTYFQKRMRLNGKK